MRERLYVAEKVMKTLFKRNKDLEEMHVANNSDEIEECHKCDKNKESTPGTDELRNRIKELEKQLSTV